MPNTSATLPAEIKAHAAQAGQIKVLIGLDGFVDKIVHPVDNRFGPGEAFDRIRTITDFGARISSAAGKSANIELAPVVEKLGGNGPIMANAQCAHGLKVRYLGALGADTVHPVFVDFAAKTEAISIADPGVSHAAEFADGKIIFGSMATLEDITYDKLVEQVGEAELIAHFGSADCIALVNWTMIPYMTGLFRDLIDRLLPKLPNNPKRRFFFDLADPEKRSDADLHEVLDLLHVFESFGSVILGLNYREAEQVDKLLGFDPLEKNPENLQALAARIQQELSINTVVVHPVECAACATPAGTAFTEGPFCEAPKITTGAGDHFNSGFVTARLIGLPPEAALTVAVATSGYYVRNGISPDLNQIADFIESWDSEAREQKSETGS